VYRREHCKRRGIYFFYGKGKKKSPTKNRAFGTPQNNSFHSHDMYLNGMYGNKFEQINK
jgi:hypothetical protein